MKRRWAAACLLAGGCQFVVPVLDPVGGSSDGSASPFDGPLALRDGQPVTGDGLVMGGDGGPLLDFSVAPIPDLVTFPDLLPPFVPSHVSPGYFTMGTSGLTVGSGIDTSALTIDGAAPPAGVTFTNDNGLAVLAAASFTIAANKTVTVKGSRPLVVVSGSTLTIAGTLDAGAHATTPGPGGSASGAGNGAGVGGGGSPYDSGGSGAGYGAGGGNSGAVLCGGFTRTNETPGTLGYGDPTLTQLLGGSGGGQGNLGGIGCPQGVDNLGGAGGGALQLTAAQSIAIPGKISVGGGGGKGGCKNQNQIDSGSGGGGGSGGSLLIESLSVDLGSSVAAANGGGGGGGADVTAGSPGSDASASVSAPAGGPGGMNYVMVQTGGVGGTNGNGGSAGDVDTCGNSGGGGGAPGRIYVRSRGAANMNGAMLSPPPTFSTNL